MASIVTMQRTHIVISQGTSCLRAAACFSGKSDKRTRFFLARSAALMDASAHRRNSATCRVPPVDTLSILTMVCLPAGVVTDVS